MNILDFAEPTFFNGGLSVDDRGALSFINDFNIDGIKRIYVVENFDNRFIRAYHGHQKEAKIFIPASGSFLICLRRMIDGSHVEMYGELKKYVLSASKFNALLVPKGYYNGCMNLCPDSRLLVLSSSTLEESKGDDWRIDPAEFKLLDDFKIEYR